MAANLVATSADALNSAETVLGTHGLVRLLTRMLVDIGYVNGSAGEVLQVKNVETSSFRPPPMPKTQRRNDGQAIYVKLQSFLTKHKQPIRLMFGITKNAIRFRRFSRRGIGKAATEETPIALARNCRHMVAVEAA